MQKASAIARFGYWGGGARMAEKPDAGTAFGKGRRARRPSQDSAFNFSLVLIF